MQADGYLYAIGGNDGSSSLNTVERYEPANNKWSFVCSMLMRRSSVGAAVLECPSLEDLLTSKIEITPAMITTVSSSSSLSE